MLFKKASKTPDPENKPKHLKFALHQLDKTALENFSELSGGQAYKNSNI